METRRAALIDSLFYHSHAVASTLHRSKEQQPAASTELGRVIARLRRLVDVKDARMLELLYKQAEREHWPARELRLACQLYDERPSDELHERIATLSETMHWPHIARLWREARAIVFPHSYELF